MNSHYQTIEQNWRILLESFGDAQSATREDKALDRDTRTELLARLEALATTLRALESCWLPIRERMPKVVEPAEDLPHTTPQREYYLPLLQVLRESGGRLRAMDAVLATKACMHSRLLEADFEATSTGRIRHDVNTRFALERLKNLGLIKATVGDGHWELTEAGIRAEQAGIIPVNPVQETQPGQMDLFS